MLKRTAVILKSKFRYLYLLLIPLALIVVTNELVRPTIHEKRHIYHGLSAINSAAKSSTKCTWQCYINTFHCKEKHVKYLKSYSSRTDTYYFGLIKLFKNTQQYALANVFILAFLIPLTICYLFIRSISIQETISMIRKNQHHE